MGTSPLDTVNNLIKRGYAVIDFPYAKLIGEIMNGWESFLEETAEYKQLFSVEKDKKDPDLGYIIRREEIKESGGKYDNKDLFQSKKLLEQNLNDQKVNYSKYAKWLNDLEKLNQICVKYGLEIADALDRYLVTANRYYRSKIQGAADLHAVRVINYYQSSNNILATPHEDKSFLTFQVFENLPGLKLLSGGNRVPHIYTEGHAVVFGGKKINKDTDGLIKKMSHGVDKETDGQRRSLISFVHSTTIL